MSPSIPSALPGAPRPASSTASGGAGVVAEPSADEVSFAANDGVDGGFAAALDQASSEREPAEAATATSLDVAPASDAPREEAPSSPTDAARGASAAAPPSAATGIAAGTAPGWPPPGLSSLFPERPMFGAAAAASAPATSPVAIGAAITTAAPTAIFSALPAAAATATGDDAAAPIAPSMTAGAPGGLRGRFALTPDAIALPADPLGPRRPDAPTATVATVATTTTSLAMPQNMAAPTPGASPTPNDAITLALARQPAALRLPVAEGDKADLGAIAALGEAFAPERPPDGASPLSTSTSALPKLDLAQAFPAPVPLPSKHFADDVGARLQWIAEQQGGEATLRISPEGLGPGEVRMKLDGDRVELGFSAAQNDTRQALQDALPKLREMLAQQGLQLGHADVGQKHAQSSNNDAAKNAKGVLDDGDADALAMAPAAREATLVIGRSGRGVLDLYA